MRTKTLSTWTTPATAYPRFMRGRAEIKTYRQPRGVYDAYRTAPPGEEPYDYYRLARAINVTTLGIGGETWMVDDPSHWWAVQEHATHYHGHVLVAGLGLGLIVHALAARWCVSRITIVEREQDVIDLVLPELLKLTRADLITVYRDDWYEYKPVRMPDGVFYDLFVGDGRELLPLAIQEAIRLRQQFGDIPIRIHGFNNDYLQAVAEAATTIKPILVDATRVEVIRG